MSKNQSSQPSLLPRRTFLKATSACAAVASAPQLLLAKKTDSAHVVIGEGEHQYECIHDWGQLPSVLVDGSMDAFILPLTFPSQRVTTMQSAGDVVIVSTPKDVFESEGYAKIFNAPGNVPVVVPWADMGYGDGKGVRLISDDATFRGIGTAFTDVVHKDMSFDLAKALVAEHIKSMDQMKQRTAFMKNAGFGILDTELSGFCGPLKLKYHPGAVAAWEEAGYQIPECAKE